METNNQVVVASPIPSDGPKEALSLVLRAATDPTIDVEKSERLMAMYVQMQERESEVAFNDAMARVQAQMRRIATDKKNSQTNSRYATYAQLDRALRPIYTNEGFALSFGTDPSAEGFVNVTCYVTHQAGHTRKYMIPMPADGKGAKGNDVMTKTHATGSATQYGMRYLLKMIFNVAIGEDEDDDGNAASGKQDDSSALINDWVIAISECANSAELRERRLEMIEKLGNGDVNLVPKAVREAAVKRASELAKGGVQ